MGEEIFRSLTDGCQYLRTFKRVNGKGIRFPKRFVLSLVPTQWKIFKRLRKCQIKNMQN